MSSTEPDTQPFALMGVLNVTPDSFSDGGLFVTPGAAVARGLELVAEGAAIVDVGGESTRPGATPVGVGEETRRVLSVIEGLVAGTAVASISVDTMKAAVARAALSAGARMVNDVSALRADAEMAEVVAESGAQCCLTHMRGMPSTMQQDPRYDNVVDDVRAFLEQRLSFAVSAGIAEERVLLDPGIGFGKSMAHNLALLRHIDKLVELGRPVVIGTSRKSFLGRIAAEAAGVEDAAGPEARLPGTIASNVLAFERGARVFRVHDVAAVRDALAVAAATLAAND